MERKKRPSARGKRAVFISIILLVCLLAMLIMSALNMSLRFFGGVLIDAAIISMLALVMGVRGKREVNATHRECNIAIILNIILLIILFMLYTTGI